MDSCFLNLPDRIGDGRVMKSQEAWLLGRQADSGRLAVGVQMDEIELILIRKNHGLTAVEIISAHNIGLTGKVRHIPQALGEGRDMALRFGLPVGRSKKSHV